MLAVGSVVVVIVLLLVLNQSGDPDDPGPAIAEPTTVLTTSASASPTPSATRSPRPTPSRTAPVDEPPATQPARIAKVPVTVLNNSTIQHLAARAAAQLRAKQWPIRLVGNYRGRLPVSTLYFLPGQKPAAQLFAKQFPAVQRVLPRPENLPGKGLTLVVTREWPA
jgi:hypothetical protein